MRNIGVRTNSEREFILVQTILFEFKCEWDMFLFDWNKKYWKVGEQKMVEIHEKGEPDEHYKNNDVVIQVTNDIISYADWSGSTTNKSRYKHFYEFDEFKKKYSKVLRKVKLKRILK